jgi:hypothetical protein
MSRKPDTSAPDTRKQPDNEKDRSREDALDEALEETFPASDPVAVGHSDHAGIPPNHREPSKKRPDERDGGA